ncbi:uncharacterized protein SPSK_10199 [Sporothrix schenckii 1099-18]|uniref:Uncharacterized protein n=1 Tax=Sporothrix schenckii 1099-18 TaxID=1397361 RepID=A0A0F2M4G9_SPOSC|nr:uncharacterized protein SPSK_10199 [Sporothrix schenckii 1099-18]KJR84608.1 hypothetical protein SPSK_10199 [Sporothrix schenckii 1099-18]
MIGKIGKQGQTSDRATRVGDDSMAVGMATGGLAGDDGGVSAKIARLGDRGVLDTRYKYVLCGVVRGRRRVENDDR